MQVFRWRHPTTGDEVVVMNEEHYGRMIVPDKTLGLTDVLRWQFTVRFRRPPACKRLSLLGLRCSEHDRLQTTFLAGLRPRAASSR